MKHVFFFCLVSFTQHGYSEIHPCCVVHQQLISSHCYTVSPCVDMPRPICSPVDGHSGRFQSGAITNRANMDIHV